METCILFTNYITVKNFCDGYEISWELDKKNVYPLDVTDDKKFIIAYDGIPVTKMAQVIDLVALGSAFILSHRHPKTDTEQLKSLLIDKGLSCNNIFIKVDSHTNSITYGRIPEIDNKKDDKTELEVIFDDLIKKIRADEILELAMNTWKTLSCYKVKVRNGAVNSGKFSDEITEFQKLIKKQKNENDINELKYLLSKLLNIDNHDDMMDKFWNDYFRKKIQEFPST